MEVGQKVEAMIDRQGRVAATVKHVLDNGDVLVSWKDRQGEQRAKIVRSSDVANPTTATRPPPTS